MGVTLKNNIPDFLNKLKENAASLVERTAEKIEDAANSNLPESSEINVSSESDGMTASVGTSDEGALALEFGTSEEAAIPFLEEAANEIGSEFESELAALWK